MTREHFAGELGRLVRGLDVKPPSEATIDALFETVVRANHLGEDHWRRVVDLALASARWPTMESWDRFVERAKASSRGPRASATRSCDCGEGVFERRRARSLWIGPGKFRPTAKDPSGALDRTIHPERYTAAIEYGCSRCGRLAWLLLEDGRTARGRTLRAGDFIAAPESSRPEPEPEDAIPATDGAFAGKPERAEAYQAARRALLNEGLRGRLPIEERGRRLDAIAEEYPEKASTIVGEVYHLRLSGVTMRASGIPDVDRPATPTMRDAGVITCPHDRVRRVSGSTVCGDCGADEIPGDFYGGSIDSLRYPWTPEAAMGWKRARAIAESAIARALVASTSNREADGVPRPSATETRPSGRPGSKLPPGPSGEPTGGAQLSPGGADGEWWA